MLFNSSTTAVKLLPSFLGPKSLSGRRFHSGLARRLLIGETHRLGGGVTPVICICYNNSTSSVQPVELRGGFFHRLHRRWFASGKPIQTVEDVADYLKSGEVEKIVVMAGAGISTPSGVPDFRTPGTGLYDNLQKYDLPYAEAIFDIDYFHQNPKPFFALAEELYPSGKYRPNLVHYFVRLLHEKGLLHKMYTQNIDGFERLAGIPPEKLMEAHGTFATATCTTCLQAYKGEDIKDEILSGKIPTCRKSTCKGVIKPDIVFFGEQLPGQFWTFTADMLQADLLIVMGTSLEVQPFASIANATPLAVPRILFNMEAAGPFVYNPRKNDVVAAGDLVEKVLEFCQLLAWKDELQELRRTAEKENNNPEGTNQPTNRQ